ncbi:MAG: hypothetical protein AAFV38_09760 [Pseudomonadota bacterium]
MRCVIAILAISVVPSAALATGEIFCEAPDAAAQFGYTFGTVPGIALVSASFTANGQSWATTASGGTPEPDVTPVAVAQAAYDSGQTLIDFVDPNFEQIVASVRLVHADNDAGFAIAGVLAVEGHGVWPMICDG